MTNSRFKFRAWDKTQKKMLNPQTFSEGLVIQLGGVIGVFNGKAYDTATDEFDIMQFSGLLDKNGKEIYGGDILGDWTDVDGIMEQSKLTVFFDEMLGSWMLDNSLRQDRSMAYSLHAELHDFEYEIIGNIYENIEILN